METNTLLWILFGIAGLISLVAFTGKHKKVMGANSSMVGVVALVIALLALGGTGTLGGKWDFLAIEGGGATSDGTSGSNANVNVNPVATYATQEKWTTAVVAGTAYYQKKGTAATTTAITNVNPGDSYTYWVSNATTYVRPIEFVAGTLNNNIVNKNGYANATQTIILYDSLGNANVQGGIANVSMGAGDTKSIVLKYQGTYQQSSAPFGGVLIVEKNSSIQQVTCTGDSILPTVPYSQVTYSVSATANNYQMFGLDSTLDDGTSSVRQITCQFKNGATDTSSPVTFKVIPANYYFANDGNIYLDVQKTANSDTARVGLGTPSATMYFT
jgi:hypothetical protein